MRQQLSNRWQVSAAVTTLAIAGLALSASSAQALSLAPGDTTALGGTTFAARPELGGVVLQDVLRTINVNGVDLELQDRVVRSNLTGTLDFYYTLRNTSDSRVPIPGLQVERSSFSGFSTDVDYRIDGLGTVPPISASRSADGSSVSFLFDPNALLPAFDQTLGDGMTRFFFVKTNATTFDANGSGVIGGAKFSTFQPTAIPTPALLPGLVGLGLTVWRNRKASQSES